MVSFGLMRGPISGVKDLWAANRRYICWLSPGLCLSLGQNREAAAKRVGASSFQTAAVGGFSVCAVCCGALSPFGTLRHSLDRCAKGRYRTNNEHRLVSLLNCSGANDLKADMRCLFSLRNNLTLFLAPRLNE